NRLLNHCQRRFCGLPSPLDAVVRVEHMHHARNARLRSPSAGIAGKTDRSSSRAVIRAIARHDLVASSKEACDLYGVLVGLSPPVGEEERINVPRSDFGELRAEPRADFGCHERIRVSER